VKGDDDEHRNMSKESFEKLSPRKKEKLTKKTWGIFWRVAQGQGIRRLGKFC
jgi:hypothetical protein